MAPYSAQPIVEMAFTYTPFSTTPTWTDVSSYVRYVSTQRGRATELDDFQAGSATITLSNRDRRFDPMYSAGPYYGNLIPNVPIRIRALYSGVYYPVFLGSVDGYRQHYATGNTDAECEITATDAFKVLANLYLPGSVYETVVEADSPYVYWQLGEATGTRATDLSGHGRHGTYSGGGRQGGQTIVPYSSEASMEFTGQSGPPGGNITAFSATDFVPSVATAELWVETGNQPIDTTQRILLWNLVDNSATGTWYGWELFAGADSATDHFVILYWQGQVSQFVASWKVDLYDGVPHHLVLFVDGYSTVNDARLYNNGVAATVRGTATTTLYTSSQYPLNSYYVGAATTSPGGILPMWTFPGRIGHVAMWQSTLTTTQVANHYVAGTAPWDNDLAHTRVGRILDLITWPSALRSLDTSETYLGPAGLANSSVLAYLQAIKSTEQGRLFMSADGKVTFHQRYRFLTNATETTPQVTFTDDGTNTGYLDGSLMFDFDDRFIFNDASVTRTGGVPQISTNATSVTAYGKRTKALSGLLSKGDAAAKVIADYIVYRYRSPQLRAESWKIIPQANVTHWPDLLSLELGYRVTLKRKPQGVGTVISNDYHVEHIAHTITPSEWSITLSASPVDTAAYFQWGSTTPLLDGWGDGVWR